MKVPKKGVLKALCGNLFPDRTFAHNGAGSAPAQRLCAMPPATTSHRDLRLDFFRGIALWLIFVDHIPHNVVNWFTVRNYGFSDAAEIFVFISGYTAAYVYARAMRERGFVTAGMRILKRVWQLYVAQIFLLVIFFAQISYVARTFENPLFTEEMNVVELLQQPEATLPHAMLLQFNPANMDILPVYIVLLLAFPPVLWCMLRAPSVTLTASLALYVAASQFGWNFPSFPAGHWVINPLCWQLLFFFGAWCAVQGSGRLAPLLHSPIILVAAALYLLFAFLVVLSWYRPWLAAYKPDWLHAFLYPIDKTNLDVLRLAHFLALAVITVRLIPRDWTAFQSPVLLPAIVCGQHSLEIFCVGIFLSFAAHFVLTEISGQVPMQILLSAAGIAIMCGVATLISWYEMIERRYGAGERPPDADIAGGSV
jgi:hypothetical protein